MTGPRCFVGIDVVDVGHPRTVGKASDERFLERVFSAAERADILAATDPDSRLWMTWAAKEAAFKIVSKLLGAPPAFQHSAFEVAWAGLDAGTVVYGDIRVAVRARRDEGGYVQTVAWSGDAVADEIEATCAALDEPDAVWSGTEVELRTRLGAEEVAAVYSRSSAAVRIAARSAAAAKLGVDEDRVSIFSPPGAPGRCPPFLHVDGAPSAADVSLSHDRRWIAWAVWAPAAAPSADAGGS